MPGIALFGLAFMHVISGMWAIAAYVGGAIAFITGVARFCPAWSLFGISTDPATHK